MSAVKKTKNNTTDNRNFGWFSFSFIKEKKKLSLSIFGGISLLGFVLPGNMTFNNTEDVTIEQSAETNTMQSQTVNINTPSVLGVQSPDIKGILIEPKLSPFNIAEWKLDRGLVFDNSYICSIGRSDRPILTASYIAGLSIDEVAIMNISVRDYKGELVVGSDQEPKAILIYDDSMIFFPAPDIARIGFDNKGATSLNKLPQPVDIKRPMMIAFEPTRIIANKLAYKYNFRYKSIDTEIEEGMSAFGSFELHQDNENHIFPRNLSIGLYAGSCIKIETFDTGSKNAQAQSYPYFK